MVKTPRLRPLSPPLKLRINAMCKRGEAKSGPPSALIRYSSLRYIWILPFRALESDVYGNEAVKQGTLPPRSCPGSRSQSSTVDVHRTPDRRYCLTTEMAS